MSRTKASDFIQVEAFGVKENLVILQRAKMSIKLYISTLFSFEMKKIHCKEANLNVKGIGSQTRT